MLDNRFLKAYLPVAESLGFHDDLRSQTHGQAFAHCMFDHWTLVEGDPLADAPNPLLDNIITPLRLAKGLPAAIPQLKRYMDCMQEAGTTLHALIDRKAAVPAEEMRGEEATFK